MMIVFAGIVAAVITGVAIFGCYNLGYKHGWTDMVDRHLESQPDNAGPIDRHDLARLLHARMNLLPWDSAPAVLRDHFIHMADDICNHLGR